ncbi:MULTISPECIES: hypothetical protein [Companilactobacillus]|uniref:Uncharacterized protein n=1 Tax=Companilactobacillus heilongjiangensis TaxID=1074467 RepID=A0A0K2LEL2_9LACO|nr:hypothetical protein [Companilactobacillus heilongjiangensis]ALB29618.1 hypothetical protein JP39_09775 [Companilactobacillus heilongjiangensis]
MINNISDQLDYFRRESGISVEIKKQLEIPMSNLDKRVSVVYRASILSREINLVDYQARNVKRAVSIIQRIRENNEFDSVIMVTQLGKDDRKFLIEKGIPFITLEGEIFLPFLGTKLFPNKIKMFNDNKTLSPVGQRLYMFILMMMLMAEKNRAVFVEIGAKNILVNDLGQLVIKGGQEFYSRVGKNIGIKNRISFSRATNDLISHGLLKASGETVDRIYTYPLESRAYFEAGLEYLVSPVHEKELKFDSAVNRGIVETLDYSKLLKSGFTGLSQVTMISDNQRKTFVTDKNMFNTLSNTVIREASESMGEPFNTDLKFLIQVQKYDLNFFNVLYRQTDKEYPGDVVDPLDLYLMMSKENYDERVDSELEDMLDNIWRDN